jgi:hypothetical protein
MHRGSGGKKIKNFSKKILECYFFLDIPLIVSLYSRQIQNMGGLPIVNCLRLSQVLNPIKKMPARLILQGGAYGC